VNLPFSSQNAAQGVQTALIGLIRTFSIESVNLIEGITTGSYSLVQILTSKVGISLPSKQIIVRPFNHIHYVIDKEQRELQAEKFKKDS